MSIDPRLGTRFGSYAIEQVLGRGGMGVVYLATDSRLGRRVALKLLSPDLSMDRQFRERFIQESRRAAALEHPNIVPVYEAGEYEGQLFIAMRHVPGSDLGSLLEREGPLSLERVAAIVEQVADALDTAHDRGLIHRDVKPANILIESAPRRDRAFLTDFGVTKRLASRSGLTQTGQFMGTVDYVAPEQIEGRDLDRRADEYSLGCVAFECLTGRPPFAKDSEIATIYAHLKGSPPKATEARAGVPPGVDDVLNKAMAKRPEARFDTCGAMADALRRVSEQTAVGSGATPPGRRRMSAAAAAALVVVAAVVATALFVAGEGTDENQPTPRRSSSPLGLVRGISRIDPKTNTVVARFDLLAGAVATGDGVVWAFRGDEILKISPASNKIVARIPIQPRSFGVIDITPFSLSVGEGAVWAASAPSLIRIDPETNEVAAERFPEGPDCANPSECPDVKDPSGVVTGLGAVWVLNPSAGTVEKLDPATNERLSLARVPNVTAAAVGEGAVWVTNVIGDVVFRIDSITAKVVRRIPLPGAGNSIAVGHGSVWVSNSTDGTVVRIDPASNRGVATIPVGQRPRGLAVGVDAVWVANSSDGTVSRIDPITNTVTAIIPVGTCEEGGPAGVAVDDDAVWVVNHCLAI